MKGIFNFIQKQCNLRNHPELQRRRNHTVYFGKHKAYLRLPQQNGN